MISQQWPGCLLAHAVDLRPKRVYLWHYEVDHRLFVFFLLECIVLNAAEVLLAELTC